MAKTKISKIEFDYKAFNAYRRSPEVQDEISKRVNAIAAAAGEGFEAEMKVIPQRAIGVVKSTTYQAKRAEAEDKVLTHAIEAGR